MIGVGSSSSAPSPPKSKRTPIPPPSGIFLPGENQAYIAKAQAERMMLNDEQSFESEIERMVTVPLSKNQWNALASFAYNLGSTSLESSTLSRDVHTV